MIIFFIFFPYINGHVHEIRYIGIVLNISNMKKFGRYRVHFGSEPSHRPQSPKMHALTGKVMVQSGRSIMYLRATIYFIIKINQK